MARGPGGSCVLVMVVVVFALLVVVIVRNGGGALGRWWFVQVKHVWGLWGDGDNEYCVCGGLSTLREVGCSCMPLTATLHRIFFP